MCPRCHSGRFDLRCCRKGFQGSDPQRNLKVLPHLHPYKLQPKYPQARRACVRARDLASHCPLFLCTFDDIAREYANFVVKASEKKTGFNQSAFQESFSAETKRLLPRSFISKGTTLSLGRHHIFSHTLQRIQAVLSPPASSANLFA